MRIWVKTGVLKSMDGEYVTDNFFCLFSFVARSLKGKSVTNASLVIYTGLLHHRLLFLPPLVS